MFSNFYANENTVNTTFRPIESSELRCAQMIANKTIDKSYRYFLEDHIVDDYLKSGRLETYLSKSINNIWALYHDNNILGISICIDNVIDFMLIDADYHRNGLGTKLLQCCENLLFENHKVIALESFEENTKACKFYETNSWIETDKYNDLKSNAVKIIYRKRLCSDADL